MALAVSSYERLPSLADHGEVLNLAWVLDERGLLTVDLSGVIERELMDEARAGLPYVYSYFVQDPYGEGLLRPALEAHFSGFPEGSSVSCGAGVNSLLHALARLTAGK